VHRVHDILSRHTQEGWYWRYAQQLRVMHRESTEAATSGERTEGEPVNLIEQPYDIDMNLLHYILATPDCSARLQRVAFRRKLDTLSTF
jgi:hypothetical protein